MGEQHFPILTKMRDGRVVNASSIRCGTCKEEGLSYSASGRPTPNRASSEKFKRMGWVVGSSQRLNRCPSCRPSAISASNNNQPKIHKLDLEQIVMAKSNPPAVTEPPREMTRDDRRIIFAKLNEVYIGEDQGYSAGWSDQKISDDLGTPKSWVERIREENFGSISTNENVMLCYKQIKELWIGIETSQKALNADRDVFKGKMAEANANIGKLIARADELHALIKRIS
ncbi:hypothetical protein [Aureimonas pseudogalii]|uniref:Uncharacterized protein n=1 Tax=Aureimonas pseudogalii TaxID=1744844 RepID=A0A7W6H2N0_9HYPH|nr:hypothetical protein [Aureimonas pseudogalii]MBB3997216.1 hypothetical protein [Aureimonas pseudogalii]